MNRPVWPVLLPDKPTVRYEIEEAFHGLYDAAQDATQMPDRAMRRLRHYNIPQAVRQAARVEGDAAEVGCYRGLSAFIACSSFRSAGRTVRFHLFDSFSGLSDPNDKDASTYLVPRKPGAPAMFACDEAVVRENLKAFPEIEYHAGWIPERFAEVADRSFCYVHIDVDLHQPTDESIRFFWPRLSRGGAMVLDDNGTVFFPGARKASEDFLAGRDDAFSIESPSGGAVVIKLR